MVIVLMGVSGCGKTTVGHELAAALGWHFEDADPHHPPANVEKMRAGIPLTEADRVPWLEKLASLIQGWNEQQQGAVLGCSALSRRAREILGIGKPDVVFVHLCGSEALIRERLERRAGHYFPPSLLASQFAALEEPTEAVAVDIDAPPADIAAEIRKRLGLG
jgi:gluconokinase